MRARAFNLKYFSKINIYSYFNEILTKLGQKWEFRLRVAMATKMKELTDF